MGVGKVLVIDDEPDVRHVVRLTLTKAGFDVIEAEDGAQGIAAVRAHPLSLDAIVCDIKMPNIDGMEAISYFRSQFPSVPVIVLTAYPSVEGATELLKKGVVEYLLKPPDPEKIKTSVSKAVMKHVLFTDQFSG